MGQQMTRPGGSSARFNSNSVTALVIVALGIAIWLLTPYQVAEPPTFFGRSSAGVSPKLFPQIIAVGMVITGACYFYLSRSMDEINGFVGLPLSAYVNLGVMLAAMIAYVAFLRPLGYVATSMVVATGVSVYYGSRNAIGIGLTGIVAPLVIFFLFTRYLGVSLPSFPWG